MKNSKFFLALVAGTVVSFLLGWVIYGIVLKSAMEANCGLPKEVAMQVFKSMDKPEPMSMGLIFVSNIFGALLLTIACGWANARSFGSGLKVGAIIGCLMALNIDFMFLAMSNLYTPTGVAIDVCAGTVMIGLTSGVIGLVLGKGKVAS